MSLTLAVADAGDGSGGTATISGADNALVTVYYQTLSVLEGASRWTAGGTRTGNGTVSVTGTGNGSYFWYAAGTVSAAPALSNVMPQSLTNAATVAVHWLCLLAYQQMALSLNLFAALGGPGTDRVSIVWTPKDILGLGPRPGLAFCPNGAEGQPGVLSGMDDIEYPVLAILFDNSTGPTANLARNLLWRQQLFSLYRHQRLPGAPSTITTNVQPQAIVVPELFNQDRLWYDALLFRPVSREKRGKL